MLEDHTQPFVPFRIQENIDNVKERWKEYGFHSLKDDSFEPD